MKLGKYGKKELYNHIKFRMVRGNQKKDESIKIKDENGLFITDEDGIVFEFEKLWGKLFCIREVMFLNRKIIVL